MKEKILCVDDEPSVLQAQKRLLRKHFNVHVAESGSEGIKLIKEKGPFAVVISDMQMPGMNGIEFLAQVKELDQTAIRIMLTGDQDLSTAENAVNEGNIFRFLRKPCPPETIAKAIKAALKQYHLVIAEKEILEETLNQTVRVLVDILEISNPQAFYRTTRVKKYMDLLAELLNLKLDNPWQYEVVPLLFPLGCISIPEEILKKAFSGQELDSQEFEIYQNYPTFGYEQLIKIPRMEEIATVIKYQEKGFDGSGFPFDSVKGEEIPLASRVLKIALDYDKHQLQGLNPHAALKKMKEEERLYDPKILLVLNQIVDLEIDYVVKEIMISDLKKGMVLAEDIKAKSGAVFAAKGQELTKINVNRIFSFSIHTEIEEPIKILVAK